MALSQKQIRRIRASGALEGSVDELMGLTPEDLEWIGVREALADLLIEARRTTGLSQVEFARMIESSQSAVSRAEHADPSVSADWLLRSIIAAGMTRHDIARALGS